MWEEVSRVIVRMRERNVKLYPAQEAVPAKYFISAERNFTAICVFACPFAELVAPPTTRHHAESSPTMIAGLAVSHHTLPQRFNGISLR
jgi:hypothetical protein